jgi:ABC-2 type transport system permease protein
MPETVLPIVSLWKRELVRFARDRSRLYGSIGQPLVFWLLMGAGFEGSFLPAGLPDHVGYLEYIFPGTLLLILLFTAIFSTISLIEDRREGFLQSVLVAPISRTSLVMGKVMGGTTLALGESAVFLLFLIGLDIPVSVSSLLVTIGFLFLLGLSMTGMGFVIAWRMTSTAGFHAVMNFFFLAMWLLWGAFFPVEGASSWLSWMMVINPLTYGMAGLRQAIYWTEPLAQTALPDMGLCVGVTVGFAVLTLGLAVWQAQKDVT